MRCMSRVINVKTDGRSKMTMKVIIGLNHFQSDDEGVRKGGNLRVPLPRGVFCGNQKTKCLQPRMCGIRTGYECVELHIVRKLDVGRGNIDVRGILLWSK